LIQADGQLNVLTTQTLLQCRNSAQRID
jgi:hypothetical protein